MRNDRAPLREDFEVEPHDDLEYIVARLDADPVAVFVILETSEIHFCFLPIAWGYTQKIAQDFLNWLWGNKSVDRFTGPVPSYNRLALKLAKSVGFSQYDVRKNAVEHNGAMYDLLLLEVARPQLNEII